MNYIKKKAGMKLKCDIALYNQMIINYKLVLCFIIPSVNGVQLRKEIEEIFRRDSGKLRCGSLDPCRGCSRITFPFLY